MRRRTFDTLMTTGGLVVTVVLVVAGALLFVGYNFANNNVHDQLARQQITMPSGQAIEDPAIKPYLAKYAGQKMTTGAQAEAYADHFIGVHISNQGTGTPYKGWTYAQLGAPQTALRTQIAALKPTDPSVPGLQAQLDAISTQRDTVFKGETLRGLLLNAYAFWKIGQIAFIAMVAAFALAVVMAFLTVLGFVHLRRVSPEAELFAPHAVERKTA